MRPVAKVDVVGLSRSGLAGLVLGACLLSPQPGAAAVFSDGTFANGNWTATVTTQTGGASSIVDGQQASGGDPGAWRKARHQFVGAGLVRVYHERQGMSFDPSTLVLAPGEQLVLDYSEDQIEITPPFGGARVGAAPALKQDGIIYAGPEINYTNTTWATATLTNLSAAEFTPYGGSGHPDFSPSGSPITFGYYRTNSNTGGSSFTITHGIDDWSFTTRIADIGTVVASQKISDTEGGFSGTLVNSDDFGECLAYLGDVDGDGIGDLATTTRDDASATDAGAVWILFLNADDTVKGYQKIAYDQIGGFVGVTGQDATAGTNDRFGQCGAGIGDLNYDGVPDLAVGTEPGGDSAIWILFLKPDGTVRSERRYPAGSTFANTAFGHDVARLGDVDGDGVVDLAVGAEGYDDGGPDRGAVVVLFLEPDGTVKGSTQISSSTTPGLGLADGDFFGSSVTGLGDLDGDGIPDLAVGAYQDDDAGTDAGAIYVLLLNDDGTVKSHQKLGSADVGGGLEAVDRFGTGVTDLGDLDGDGVPDLAVGAARDDDGSTDYGAAYVLFLNANGSAKDFQKLSRLEGGLNIAFNTGDEFGIAVEGYAGADGAPRLAVGARQDDDGGTNRGAIHVLTLAGLPRPTVCGDFVLEGAEACDDGNKVSGDTCSATCEIEEVLFLRGSASGGNVQVTVSGEVVNVASGGGQTAVQVVAALAAAINANATLQGLGVTATSRGQVLYTTGAITASSTSDPGLTLGERDDLVLEGSSLGLDFPLVGVITDPGETSIDQAAPSLALTVAQTGGFTLPASAFTDGLANDAIICAAGSGSLLTNPVPAGIPFTTQPISIHGAPGVRCVGGLSGARSVLSSAPGSTTTYAFTIPYGLQAVGVGGVESGSPLMWRAGGLPWTAGTAVAADLIVTSFFQGLPVHGTSQPNTRRGVEARRADGVGVFNPVTPIAFNSQVLYPPNFTSLFYRSEAAFGQLRLRFVPEPAVALGLVAGAFGLGVLSQRRRR